MNLRPASNLPAAYYAVAHLGFAAALAVLVVDPTLPGASFYHPRLVALVHAVTITWITGSILGSFFIVGPLALRVPMPVGRADWVAFAAFVTGAAGMLSHFWIGTYDGMAWSAGLVTATVLHVGWRASTGLRHSPAPGGVSLHVVLAFTNMLAAAVLGILIGINRTRGFMTVPALGTMFAHAHLAAIGWAAMMVIGLSYRLIPMMLPASMPTGAALATSAILIELGLATLVATLMTTGEWAPLGASLIVAGLASFVIRIHGALKHRMPRPPALPTRDWSTWQTHVAFLWLLIAATLGLVLSTGAGGESRLSMMWLYGTAGLVGFLGQIVAGIQGRLVPLYAWYRAFDAGGKQPPPRAANDLPTPRFAKPVFFAWTAGVPLLAWGLSMEAPLAIRLGAACLLMGVVVGAAYIRYLLRAAADPPRPGA